MSLRPWLTGFRARLSNNRCRRLTKNQARQTEQLEQRTLLTATALVIGTDLTVLTDAAENVTVQANTTSGNAEVLIDGTVLASGSTVPAGSLTSLTIVTGSGDNQIDLSGVTASVFTSLAAISVDSGDGEDVIIGTADVASSLSGGDGNDSITGGTSAEVIRGGDGQDTIDGGDGNDDINAGDGDDSVTAGAGNDTVTGDDGDDIVFGGAGNDSVLANNGADSLFGEAGDDTLNGDGGFDSIDGGDGNDLVFAGADNDTVSGGLGDDTVNGQAGNDSINGDDGNDVLNGQAGQDSINGGLGNDIANGNSGDDSLLGGDNNDTLEGQEGDDISNGHSGNDTLIGRDGSDILNGGAGDDLIDNLFPVEELLPFITIASLSASEGDAGTQLFGFDLTLSAASVNIVTVDFSTADDTATAGMDYVQNMGSVTFLPGELMQTITVTVNGDIVAESQEQFFVNLTNPINASLNNSQAIGQIVEDDGTSLPPGLNVTATDDVTTLTNAVVGTTGGISVTSSTLSGQSALPDLSTGTFTAGNGAPYGLVGNGIILSTGDVADYAGGPNTGSQSTAYGVAATAAQETILDPITDPGGNGNNHFDVTQFDITFDLMPGYLFTELILAGVLAVES